MKLKILVSILLGATLAMAFYGCGGGSGSSAPATTSKGVITALGSIFVNGVEFSTSNSSVTSNKSSGSVSDLRVGRVVTVKGHRSDDLHGSAVSVEYKDNLQGPLDLAPDLVNNKLQVLGQTILVNTSAPTVAAGKTVFQGFAALSDLSTGSLVEISGLPNDVDGTIQATYIELKGTLAAGSQLEIKGSIATGSLNTSAKTFKIGALTIDYNGASLSSLSGSLAEGLFVEVKGVGSGYSAGASPTLAATKIENEKEEAEGVEHENLSIQGIVSGLSNGSSSFKVGGQAVNTGSLSLAGISNGSKVEVEGTFSAGVLIATKIKIDN